MTTGTATRPRADRRRWWILAVLCLSVLVIGVDNTIVNLALPTISRELAATTRSCSGWSTPTRGLRRLVILGGNLGDRFGRRRVLQLGIAAFAVTSVASALSRSTGELIAGRAAMGSRRPDLPSHARPAHERSPTRASAPPRSASGPACPAWPSGRAGDRRPAAGALLVELRLLGQRAGRHHRPGRRHPRGAGDPRPPAGPVRPPRRLRSIVGVGLLVWTTSRPRGRARRGPRSGVRLPR